MEKTVKGTIANDDLMELQEIGTGKEGQRSKEMWIEGNKIE